MEKPELNVVECEGARSVAVSPDGKLICLARAGGGNGAAIVQTNSTFQCELEGTELNAVASVAWASGDGLRVAAGGTSPTAPNALQPSGGYVLVCEPERGARIFATQIVAPVTCLSMSVDDGGSRLAVGRSDGIVEVLDAFTGNPVSKARLRGYESRFNHRAPFAGLVPDIPMPPRSGAPPTPIASVCWHCDGSRVGVAHATHATVLDLNLVQLPPYLDMMPNEVVVPHQGSTLEDDMADDTQAIVTQTRLGCGSQVVSVALSPAGTDPPLFAYCGGARVAICHAEDGLSVTERRLDDFKGNGNDWRAALSVAFCPAHAQTAAAAKPGQLQLVVGGELASGTQGAVAVFDAVAGTMLSVHQARSPVVCVGVAADGRSMALGERRLDAPAPPSPFLQQPAAAPAPNPFATGQGATGIGAAPAPANRGPALFVFGAGNEAKRIEPPPPEEKPEDRASRFGCL